MGWLNYADVVPAHPPGGLYCAESMPDMLPAPGSLSPPGSSGTSTEVFAVRSFASQDRP